MKLDWSMCRGRTLDRGVEAVGKGLVMDDDDDYYEY